MRTELSDKKTPLQKMCMKNSGKANPAKMDLLIRDQTLILASFILKLFKQIISSFFLQNIDQFFTKSIHKLSPHFFKIKNILIRRHCESNKSI